jgi:hypothetical protein
VERAFARDAVGWWRKSVQPAGRGYARVNIRQDGASGEITVLEANANCGRTSDDQTSAGAVLGLAGIPLPEFVRCALHEAWLRRHGGSASPV